MIWLSANRLGYELLKEAIKMVRIDAIVTLSDSSSTVMYDSVPYNAWDEFGVPVYRISQINEEGELFKKLNSKYIIMCGWRQIIPTEILSLSTFIGFHPTLLPIGRGPAPIINTILSGFKTSGLTLFYVEEGLDNGDIIAQESFSIDADDYAGDVYKKVIAAGKKIVLNYLPKIVNGDAPRIPQDDSKSTVFEKLPVSFNRIDLVNEEMDFIKKKIRALSKPYRGAYIEKNGERIVIWKINQLEKSVS